MAVLEPSEVLNVLRRDPSEKDVALISELIVDVVAEVETHLRRTLEDGARTETVSVPADPEIDGRVFVPLTYTPVNSISSVTVNGTAQAATAFLRERSGVVLLTYPVTNTANELEVAVTYDGGLGAKAVAALRPMIKRRVVRLMNKIEDEAIGTQSTNVEGYSVKYDTEGFTPDEEKLMAPFRRKVNASRASTPNADIRGWNVL